MEASLKATKNETTLLSKKAKGGAVVWAAISEKLSELVSSDAFDRWFSGVSDVSLTESEFRISVPNDIHQVWIETNFMPELQNAVSEILDPMVKAIVVVHGEEDNVGSDDEGENGFQRILSPRSIHNSFPITSQNVVSHEESSLFLIPKFNI